MPREAVFRGQMLSPVVAFIPDCFRPLFAMIRGPPVLRELALDRRTWLFSDGKVTKILNHDLYLVKASV